MQNSNEIKQKVSSSFNKEDGEVVNLLGKNREITEAGTDFYFSERVMSKSFLSFLLTHEFPCGLELMIILCLSKIYFVFCFAVFGKIEEPAIISKTIIVNKDLHVKENMKSEFHSVIKFIYKFF